MSLFNKSALVLWLVLLSACSRPTVIQSGPKVVIAVGGQAQLVYLPVTLAAQLGYYHDEGLEVELHDFPGGSKALEALLGGSADVVSGFFDHTVQMAAEGKRIRSFVAMLRYPPTFVKHEPWLRCPRGSGARWTRSIANRCFRQGANGGSRRPGVCDAGVFVGALVVA